MEEQKLDMLTAEDKDSYINFLEDKLLKLENVVDELEARNEEILKQLDIERGEK